MAINREAMERRLDEIVAKSIEHHPPEWADFPDHAVRAMFMQGVVDHFSSWFDERGWPQEMPVFTFLPPIEIPGSKGFAGYRLSSEEEALWEMHQVDGKFIAVA